MSESLNTARLTGATPAGSRFPERPACAPKAPHDIP